MLTGPEVFFKISSACGPALGPTLKRPCAIFIGWWAGRQLQLYLPFSLKNTYGLNNIVFANMERFYDLFFNKLFPRFKFLKEYKFMDQICFIQSLFSDMCVFFKSIG